MFTTKFPAWSNRVRLAWASASLASRTPSITTCFTAVRCIFLPSASLTAFSHQLSAISCQLFVFCRFLLQLEELHKELLSPENPQVQSPALSTMQGKAL